MKINARVFSRWLIACAHAHAEHCEDFEEFKTVEAWTADFEEWLRTEQGRGTAPPVEGIPVTGDLGQVVGWRYP